MFAFVIKYSECRLTHLFGIFSENVAYFVLFNFICLYCIFIIMISYLLLYFVLFFCNHCVIPLLYCPKNVCVLLSCFLFVAIVVFFNAGFACFICILYNIYMYICTVPYICFLFACVGSLFA